jgi:hypothetical protein
VEVTLMGQTQELMALRQRVDGWRRNGGGRGSRIPEELWTSAVDVARDAGLYATARTLHFNYEGLKKRAQAAGKRKRGRGAAFVAVQMPAFNGGAKVVVDLVGVDGEQVRIDVTGADAMDVVALAQAFWRRRP